MTLKMLAATAAGAIVAGAFAIGFASPSQDSSVRPAAKIGNFRLVDQFDAAHELYRLKDAKAVLVVAHSLADPNAAAHASSLDAIRRQHPSVEVMLINSNPDDSRSEIRAATSAYPVPVLHDENQLIGEMLGVTRSGEAFLIDTSTWKVAYQGALDRSSAKRAAAGYAAEAIGQLIAGQPVRVAMTETGGAAIAFPERGRAKEFAKISYAETVAPILEAKCVACHSEGGIGPFAMSSYEVVKGFAPMIAESIRTDRMPPWEADPHVGTFSNDKSLSNSEIKTLVHWIEAGAPRGEGADPLAAKRQVAVDWPLGEPDIVIDIPSYQLPASGVVDYQYPWVENPLKEGKWLRASTIRAGARQGVHHILTGAMEEIPGPGQGQSGWRNSVASLGDYAVGSESTLQPENIGVYIPAGGALGFQMHYTPYGKASEDKSQIGLYFYKDGETPDMMMREFVIADSFIKIPPYAAAHKEVAYAEFPRDAILYSAFVHAHYRGKASDLKIRYPDGREEMLLSLPFYDFNWQRYYDLAEPLRVPAGSKLIASYTYDNSKRNPANPDPSATVVWGDQSFEEMFFTKIRYRWVDETSANQTNYQKLINETRMFGMLDDNVDGKLQKTELRGPLEAQSARFDSFDANKDGGLDKTEIGPVMQAMASRFSRN
jgi:mono/diheme cytochrome c family protein